jgi:UDP-N-acetylmuramoyl-tripeptide--D-alanyl-D-alanine ligase
MKVCLDSRLIRPGEYFVPVKGENFDGRQFINSVMVKGAAGVIEERELYETVKKKMKKIRPKIIGITGSSGKTITSSFIAQILSTKYNICLGNLNTKLGLSVNVMNDMQDKCQIFVAEMGMDHQGELKDTTAFFPLDVGVITTINHVHVEKLGSMTKLVSAKGELLDGIKNGGVAVLNEENRYTKILGKSFKGRVLWFNSHPLLSYPSKVLGDFTVRNLNVCTLISRLLGLTDAQTLSVVNRLEIPKGRLNLIKGINNSTIIDDSYNANPESVRYALGVLNKYKGKRKVAIIGDMLELGNFTLNDHREIGKYINSLGIDIFIGVGNIAKTICTQINRPKRNVLWIENSGEFTSLLKKGCYTPQSEDVILVKGSQGKRMERIVAQLIAEPEKAPSLLVRQGIRWIKEP